MALEIIGRRNIGCDLSHFEVAWLSTFEESPDSFSEVTKLIQADKS